MNSDSEVRLHKILKYGGAGLAALLILGVFAWRLEVAQRRAEAAEAELATLRMTPGRVKPAPTPQAPPATVDPDAATRKMLVGRWVNHGIADGRDCTRTLEFDQNGTYHFRAASAGLSETSNTSEIGLWSVRGDIVFIDVKSPEALSLHIRLIRLTTEKLCIRNEVGTERVYDRVK